MSNLFDAAKAVFPEATDEEVHSLLWCCTPFPCSGHEATVEALQHMRAKASTPAHAVWLAHAEMDLIWEETRVEREAELEAMEREHFGDPEKGTGIYASR